MLTSYGIFFKDMFQVFIKHRMAKVKCVSHLGPKMIEYILLNTEIKEVTLASRVFQAIVIPCLFSPRLALGNYTNEGNTSCYNT